MAHWRDRNEPLGSRAAEGTRQQSLGRGVKGPDSGGEPRTATGSLGRNPGGRAGRSDLRTWTIALAPTWSACCGRPESCRPNTPEQRGQAAARSCPRRFRHRYGRGTQSKAVFMPISVYVERRTVRVRDRFPRRRRNGLLGTAANVQPATIRLSSSASVRKQLREKDGRYEIRVTNELEETLFLDRLQLIAIDHPQNISVFPERGHDGSAEAVSAVRRQGSARAASRDRRRRPRRHSERSQRWIGSTWTGSG